MRLNDLLTLKDDRTSQSATFVGRLQMIRFLRKLWKDRRGNALVIAAAALPLLIGSAGLATDTIQWTVWKRQLQRAADSAALAGVRGIVAGQTLTTGTCSSSGTPAVSRDLTLNNHVFLGNGNTACNTVHGLNWSGAGNDTNAVKVTLSVTRALGFSSMFLSAAPTITASATATVVATGQYCVVSLESSNATGLTYQGSATVNLGCGMATNSKGSDAVDGGGAASVTASPIAAVGGIPPSSVFSSGTVIQPYTAPQPDPYANIAPPSNFPSGNCPNLSVNSNQTVTSLNVNSDYKLTSDGYFCVGSMSLNGNVTLPSGVYVLDAGSLSIGSQAVVNCSACTFIFTSRTAATNPQSIGGISNINGGATIHMTSSTGGTYSGILMYQDRRAVLPNGNQANQVNGNSSSSFQGGFYFPSQRLLFNGTSGMTTDCVQMVARQVTFSGNTAISNVCPPGGPQAFDATTIGLVA
jgi:Flp pilus assembly protein TadG